ncbi:UDP-3-O-(3-hydroxymyristoyl)glucosamine N-acyltransferase [Ferruginivarius sediminum]|uniref:UDP-3-O-acylglucosamine N-acyltransferase n=1 Tax=Ferruginivarius sediminum TaxID=2661937 RepID=A0A369TA07_9PROT|nr:UDP-3-O-(3-hydroxymyristoyl)glucosamine N-acyltransferase [Ferruginivarius sediminum]RDD62130.1 UDP-3-O-(3-hydroxymyristoyl)glucosamine N-acyltransferase [Ferruginivarius sediminum]
MADARFFELAGPYSLNRLEEISGATLANASDAAREFEDVAPLSAARAQDVSFLDNKRYLPDFQASKAGACVVDPTYADHAPAGMALLVTSKPYRAFARIAAAFHPEPPPLGRVDDHAHIDPRAALGTGTTVEAGAIVNSNAQIGERCHIDGNAVIGEGVVIGDDCIVGANASLSHCLVGSRVRIHPGVRIGQRGFGFDMSDFPYLDVPQLGRVIVEEDVEIGANSTIDRGAGPDTVIGAGSKLDNLVQIGHNVQVGRGCVVVAQAGIAGSSVLEDFAVVAAQAGVAGHLRIGRGAQIAATSGVMRDVPAGQKVAGAPAMPVRDFFRLVSIWQRLLKAKGKSDE